MKLAIIIMLGLMLILIGTIGFGLASYWDLKTTEFPDWLPYSIILTTITIRFAFSFSSGDWRILWNSLMVGTIFLGIGLLLYFTKQWGDGDAWLLGSLGFILSGNEEFGINTFFPFPLTVLFNFLFISLIYLILYSIALGIKNRRINKKYIEHLKNNKTILACSTAFFFVFSWCISLAMHLLSFSAEGVLQMAVLPFFLTFILFFSHYAKILEKNLFKKRIKASELKEGDVILSGRWKGLTKNEVKEMQKKNRYVWIKEGVRFAPVFLITLIISIFYGDLILILI